MPPSPAFSGTPASRVVIGVWSRDAAAAAAGAGLAAGCAGGAAVPVWPLPPLPAAVVRPGVAVVLLRAGREAVAVVRGAGWFEARAIAGRERERGAREPREAQACGREATFRRLHPTAPASALLPEPPAPPPLVPPGPIIVLVMPPLPLPPPEPPPPVPGLLVLLPPAPAELPKFRPAEGDRRCRWRCRRCPWWLVSLRARGCLPPGGSRPGPVQPGACRPADAERAHAAHSQPSAAAPPTADLRPSPRAGAAPASPSLREDGSDKRRGQLGVFALSARAVGARSGVAALIDSAAGRSNTAPAFCRCSSVGQSGRFIRARSVVQIHASALCGVRFGVGSNRNI